MSASQRGPPTGGPNDLLATDGPERSDITSVELRDAAELGDDLEALVDGGDS